MDKPNKAAELSAGIRSTLEQLANETDKARQSELFRNYLKTSAAFWDYSWHNQMLIWRQRPDASYVGGFNTWLKCGRYARRGEKRRAKFSVLVVWKFDRFARSTSHLLRALGEFSALGIDFVSVTQAIDTSTPAGKMVFTVLGAVAELERSIIRERVIPGQNAAKRRGVKFGRPVVAVDAAHVSRLRGSGMSWHAIAAQTGIAKDTLKTGNAVMKNLMGSGRD